MLDRTIPFYNTILKCNHYQSRAIHLPRGFYFKQYQKGYEKAWAALEYEIGDFESQIEAESYFADTYLTNEKELLKRGVFLVNEQEEVVGSCIAWFDNRQREIVSSLHWLVVSPRYQGRGLGRALCQKVMQIFSDLDELPVYIHTQPWSYKAIFLYISLGFKLQKTDTFSHYQNQYDLSISTLKKIVDTKHYDVLISNSQS